MLKKRTTHPIKRISTVLLVTLLLFVLYQSSFLVRVVWFNFYNPSSSAIMRHTLTELRETDPQAQLSFEWVDYEQISPHLKRAVISSEDANFLAHKGVEWDAIKEAWDYNKEQAAQGRAFTKQQMKYFTPTLSDMLNWVVRNTDVLDPDVRRATKVSINNFKRDLSRLNGIVHEDGVLTDYSEAMQIRNNAFKALETFLGT